MTGETEIERYGNRPVVATYTMIDGRVLLMAHDPGRAHDQWAVGYRDGRGNGRCFGSEHDAHFEVLRRMAAALNAPVFRQRGMERIQAAARDVAGAAEAFDNVAELGDDPTTVALAVNLREKVGAMTRTLQLVGAVGRIHPDDDVRPCDTPDCLKTATHTVERDVRWSVENGVRERSRGTDVKCRSCAETTESFPVRASVRPGINLPQETA